MVNTQAQQYFWQSIDALCAGDVASTEVLTAYEGWSIKRLAAFFVKHGITGAPVVAADHSLVGVVTQSDVIAFESRTPTDKEIQKVLQHYYGPTTHGLTEVDLQHMKEKASETCTVNAIMTPEVVAVDCAASASTACQLMVSKNLHRLFVTRDDKIEGVITAMDILRYLVKEAEPVTV